MRTSYALAALCVSAVTGSAAGWALPRWARAEALASRAQAERDEAVTRAAQAEGRWDELASRLHGEADAALLDQALASGLVTAIEATQPACKPGEARRIGAALVGEARARGLDPFLLAAVARVESRFDPFATSPAGARGLMQLLPSTGRSVARTLGAALRSDAELYDVELSARLGAEYLASLVAAHPTLEAALLAYHRGPEGARRLLGSDSATGALGGYPRAVLAARDGLVRRSRAAPRE